MSLREYIVVFFFIVIGAIVALIKCVFRNERISPPGPTPLPLVGNLFQVPRRYPVKHFAKWKDLYGSFFHFRIFGRRFFMLSDLSVAQDLLEKRSSIYSSRPELPMAKLIGRDKTALFLPSGSRLKKTRKLMVAFLNARSEEFYIPVIEGETYRFLHRLLREPEDFFRNINSLPSAIILKLVYDYQIDYEDDYFVQLAEKLGRLTTEATDPGRWLVDSFPRLQLLPSWLPRMGFMNWASEARSKCEAFIRAPHEFVKSSVAKGQYLTSFTSLNLAKLPLKENDYEEILIYTSASLYSGGTDTVVSTIKLFFLMMAIHPDIQERAQKDLDLLIGDERAPRISDQSSLPFIDCIIKELLRFNPVVPIVVHSPEKDDIYNEYLIPKGSWVMANIWCMSHEASVYPEPHEFKPERFDRDSEDSIPQPDPLEFIFGFGRRNCPGRYFAERSLFMLIASVLWAFKISPEKKCNDQPCVPEVAFSSGHTVHPLPFRCSFQVRSVKSVAVIEEFVKSCE
ncbi:hypothetical protein ACEPAG_3913 [Sanghuangporus baumii]